MSHYSALKLFLKLPTRAADCGYGQEEDFMDKANLIALTEAARLLGVSVFTVRRLAEAGDLKTVNVGARRLIPVTEVERVVATGAGKPRVRKMKRRRSAGRNL
jgi:excisionase family DNA binding protein